MSSTAPTPKRASRRRDHASTTEGGQLQHAPQQQDHHDKARPDAFAPAQPTPGNDETASLPDPEDVAPKDRLSVVRALADDRGVLLEGYLRQRTRHSLLKKWKRRYFVINVATRELRYYMSMEPSSFGNLYLDERGAMPLHMIKSVEIPADLKNEFKGCRFRFSMLRVGDVRYTSAFLRHDVTHALPSKTYVFELVTEHPEECRKWVKCLSYFSGIPSDETPGEEDAGPQAAVPRNERTARRAARGGVEPHLEEKEAAWEQDSNDDDDDDDERANHVPAHRRGASEGLRAEQQDAEARGEGRVSRVSGGAEAVAAARWRRAARQPSSTTSASAPDEDVTSPTADSATADSATADGRPSRLSSVASRRRDADLGDGRDRASYSGTRAVEGGRRQR